MSKRYHYGLDQHSGCWRVYDSCAVSVRGYCIHSGDDQYEAAAVCRRHNEDWEVLCTPYNPPPATTCIEHAYGTTTRLSFQIKVFWAMDAATFARNEIEADRYPSIGIYPLAGAFYLADNDWALLSDGAFPSRTAAEAARSKIVARAVKRHAK
jgi:hypothetical protein